MTKIDQIWIMLLENNVRSSMVDVKTFVITLLSTAVKIMQKCSK